MFYLYFIGRGCSTLVAIIGLDTFFESMDEPKERCGQCNLLYFVNSYKHLPDQKHQCLMICCGIRDNDPTQKCQDPVDASHVCPKCLRHIHTFHGKQSEDRMRFSKCYDCFPSLWDPNGPEPLETAIGDLIGPNDNNSVTSLTKY